MAGRETEAGPVEVEGLTVTLTPTGAQLGHKAEKTQGDGEQEAAASKVSEQEEDEGDRAAQRGTVTEKGRMGREKYVSEGGQREPLDKGPVEESEGEGQREPLDKGPVEESKGEGQREPLDKGPVEESEGDVDPEKRGMKRERDDSSSQEEKEDSEEDSTDEDEDASTLIPEEGIPEDPDTLDDDDDDDVGDEDMDTTEDTEGAEENRKQSELEVEGAEGAETVGDSDLEMATERDSEDEEETESQRDSDQEDDMRAESDKGHTHITEGGRDDGSQQCTAEEYDDCDDDDNDDEKNKNESGDFKFLSEEALRSLADLNLNLEGEDSWTEVKREGTQSQGCRAGELETQDDAVVKKGTETQGPTQREELVLLLEAERKEKAGKEVETREEEEERDSREEIGAVCRDYYKSQARVGSASSSVSFGLGEHADDIDGNEADTEEPWSEDSPDLEVASDALSQLFPYQMQEGQLNLDPLAHIRQLEELGQGFGLGLDGDGMDQWMLDPAVGDALGLVMEAYSFLMPGFNFQQENCGFLYHSAEFAIHLAVAIAGPHLYQEFLSIGDKKDGNNCQCLDQQDEDAPVLKLPVEILKQLYSGVEEDVWCLVQPLVRPVANNFCVRTAWTASKISWKMSKMAMSVGWSATRLALWPAITWCKLSYRGAALVASVTSTIATTAIKSAVELVDTAPTVNELTRVDGEESDQNMEVTLDLVVEFLLTVLPRCNKHYGLREHREPELSEEGRQLAMQIMNSSKSVPMFLKLSMCLGLGLILRITSAVVQCLRGPVSEGRRLAGHLKLCVDSVTEKVKVIWPDLLPGGEQLATCRVAVLLCTLVKKVGDMTSELMDTVADPLRGTVSFVTRLLLTFCQRFCRRVNKSYLGSGLQLLTDKMVLIMQVLFTMAYSILNGPV